MQKISVVIISKNESSKIVRTIRSVSGLTDDIIVYDNGSSDDTVQLARNVGANVHEGKWEGFGPTKNKAANLAKYDWILSLDADEPIDEVLKNSILSLELKDEPVVYELRFRNYFGNKFLRYGEWGGDKHIRLFNRKFVKWDEAAVHEQLILPANAVIKRLPGHVLHLTAVDVKEYEKKMTGYAMLNAEKYYGQGKRSSKLRPGISAAFSFIKNYIFRGGFLDGTAGYRCAITTARYTFLKYARLRELNKINDQS